MSKEKKSLAGAATPNQAKETTAKANDQDASYSEHTTNGNPIQAGTVSKLLSNGKAGAITGAELVKLLELKDLRELTQLVEAERRAGIPICASTDSAAPGYYLADGPDELAGYLSSLDRRLHNIRQTRQRLEDTLSRLTGQERIGLDGKGR